MHPAPSLLAVLVLSAAVNAQTNALPIAVGEPMSEVSNKLAAIALTPKSVLATPTTTMVTYENVAIDDGIAKLFMIFKKSALSRFSLTSAWSNQNGQYYLKKYERQNSNLISQQYQKKNETDYLPGETTNMNRQTIFFRDGEIAISILEYTEQRKNIYLVVESKTRTTPVESK